MAEHPRPVAVVTGASSGIGKAVAKALAARGFDVFATGRDAGRIAAAREEIAAASGGGRVEMIQADLSLMAEARAAAARIAALTERVDILVNNAGGMAAEKAITAEGLERNFAGNHLGPFLLTELLLPLLRRAAAGRPAGSVRILNTASDASEMVPGLDLDDMQNLERFSPGLAYCTGKLANVLHARALAERLATDGVVAHAVHPGSVDSNFFAHVPAQTRAHTDKLEKISNEDGADTLVWLATAPEGGRESGGYWHKRARRPHNPVVDDPAVRERFWRESEALVASASR